MLVRGLDAMAVTFIAPHSLHARPLVVPRGLEVTVRNVTADVAAALLVDGHRVGELAPANRGRRLALRRRRACLRRCPRRRSSAATARPSRPERTMVGVGRRLYDSLGAAPTANREPRAHPRGRARARARAERDHGRDRGGQDDPRAGGRAAARPEGRRLVRRACRRGGLRRGRARSPGRARRARRAAARGRGRAARGAARLGERPHARVRMGADAPPARTSRPRSSG